MFQYEICRHNRRMNHETMAVRIWLFFFLATLAIPASYCTAAAPATKDVLAEAWSLFKAAKYEEAIPKFQAAIKQAESADAYRGLGESNYKLNKFAEALPALLKYKSLAPADGEATHWVGWTYLRLNRPYEAVANLEESNRLQKRSLNYLGIGWAHVQLWDFDSAESAILKATAMEPSNGDCLNALGWTYYYMKRYGAACAQFDKAISIRRNDDDFACQMLCYKALGRNDEAVASIDSYLAKGDVRKGTSGDLKTIQAYCHLANGDYESAKQILSGLSATAHIGIWLHSRGKETGLRIHTVFRYSPAFFAHMVTGDTISGVDDVDLKEKIRNEYWNYVNKQQAGARIRLAILHDGKPRESTVTIGITPELIAMIEKLKLEVKGHYDKGNDLFDARNYKGAIDSYKKALELEDTFAPLYHNLAMAQLAAGLKREAAANLESYLERRPNVANAAELRKLIEEGTAK